MGGTSYHNLPNSCSWELKMWVACPKVQTSTVAEAFGGFLGDVMGTPFMWEIVIWRIPLPQPTNDAPRDLITSALSSSTKE